MQLAYRYFGGQGNPPLIVIHGLLGSSRNWISVCKQLVNDFEVFALDLRNHGNSPHADEMTYEQMAKDVKEFITEQKFTRVNLIGHSLGGKVAMYLAVHNRRLVESLIIEDIAPKTYPPHNARDIEGMNALDLTSLKSRKEADEFLKKWMPDWSKRQFILTNLVRNEDGDFKWQVNLSSITKNLDEICKNPLIDGDQYMGPSLFIVGGVSDFVSMDDASLLQKFFSRNVLKIVNGAGHNVHQERKDEFIESVLDFYKIEWGVGI